MKHIAWILLVIWLWAVPVIASYTPSGQEIINVIDAFLEKAYGHKYPFVINEIMIVDAAYSPSDAGDVIVDVNVDENRYLVVIHEGKIVAAQKLSNKAPDTSCDSPLLPFHP